MSPSKKDYITVYNSLYNSFYMNDWPGWKKRRIANLLKSLHFNGSCKILDYGCGSGVFTKVIKKVLPDADVYGTDISNTGLQIASSRVAGAKFIAVDRLSDGYYDLIFSHHVLEHVDDINTIAVDFYRLLKPGGIMFHVLPCGNKGNLDYFIVSNTINGIKYEKGNTFFYEEELHLNRFTTVQLDNIFSRRNFVLFNHLYANHALGCFYEMTGMNTQHIRRVTDSKNAISKTAGIYFNVIRFFALLFYYLQRPYTFLKLKGKNKAWTGPLLRHPELENEGFPWLEILLFPSWFFVVLREAMERLDWLLLSKCPSGSEMYLFFKKVRE